MRILIIEKDTKSAGAIKKGLEDMNFGADVASEKEQIVSTARHSSVDLVCVSLCPPLPARKMKFFKPFLKPKLIFRSCTFQAKRGAGSAKTLGPDPKPILDLMGKFQATLGSGENSRGAQHPVRSSGS